MFHGAEAEESIDIIIDNDTLSSEDTMKNLQEYVHVLNLKTQTKEAKIKAENSHEKEKLVISGRRTR